MTIYRNPVVDFAAITKNQRYKAIQSLKYGGDIKADTCKFYIAPWNAL
jgi:hypothetical protein